MNVYGYEVSENQQRKALNSVGHGFRAMELQRALEDAGVKRGDVSDRAADRLLQREKRAGRIIFDRGRRLWWKQGEAA